MSNIDKDSHYNKTTSHTPDKKYIHITPVPISSRQNKTPIEIERHKHETGNELINDKINTRTSQDDKDKNLFTRKNIK